MLPRAISKVQAALVVVMIAIAISFVAIFLYPRSPQGISPVKIEIVLYGFTPANPTLVIGVNNTVIWTNEDPVLHTATDKQGAFGSMNLDTNQSFTYTFTSPGVYNYYCKLHPLMEGQITVKA